MAKLMKEGYGQLELNLVAFPRDGRVVAQYKAGETFTTKDKDSDEHYLENGMLLKVDGAKRCVDKAAPAFGDIFALNYSTEHMYDERQYGLKTFRLNSTDDFYPRLGYLSAGDKFTTNAVCYDTTKSVMEAWDEIKRDFEGGTAFYGVACEEGYIKLVKNITAAQNGPILRVIKVTTMPDTQPAVKFEVIRG
jgi:hypothetical protein